MTGRDPLRYFRVEAREILDALDAGLLLARRGEGSLDELFRLAHTLKGAARVTGQSTMADLSHALEDVLAHHRDTREPLTDQEIRELSLLVDGLRKQLPAREPEQARAHSEPDAAHGRYDVLHIALDEMDGLVGVVLEAQVQVASIKSRLRELAGLAELGASISAELAKWKAEARSSARLCANIEELVSRARKQEKPLIGALERLELQLTSAAERASALRLIHVSALFPELERAAVDAARATGRKVSFSAALGQVGIDGHVLSLLRGCLIHLVNNAVVHGIEDIEERARCAKPESGSVHIQVERRGARVAISVEDDGRGIDARAVELAAKARGVVGAASETAQARAQALIFEPGVSTAEQVSPHAGRGVGLDAVRQAIRRCKGTISVSSTEGVGTRFEIVVPTSLTAVRALRVSAGGHSWLVPLDAVEGTTGLAQEPVLGSGEDAYVLYEGATVPFRPLATALNPHVPSTPGRIGVILRTRIGRIMMGVDLLGGTRDIIVHPLPAMAGRSALAAGAAFDAFGDPELVLDPEGLLSAPTSPVKRVAPPSRKPVLVIDDSLTTRMLEQSILETAGYTVDVAASAEEGLRKAAERSYGLFVVDVEMPGMNGYEFTRKTREMSQLADVPVIMVSSLSSDESRARGRAAGVSAYIVKGEFDQGRFLSTVAELLP